MFSITTLKIDPEVVVRQDYIRLAQSNNEAKFPHLQIFGYKKFFKIDTYFSIVVFVIKTMTAIVVPVLYLTKLEMN